MTEDILIHLAGSLPTTFDPAAAYDSPSTTAIQNIYETLVAYEESQVREVVPRLAESWEVSPDSRHFTFKLRSGICFHNGYPLDAHAVVYSLRRVIQMNQAPAWILAQCLDEDGLRTVDELTVEMTLTRPFPGFLHCLANTVASIVAPTTVEMQGGTILGQENAWMGGHAVGTGPFMLSEWQPGRTLLLLRNDRYWREPARIAEARIYLMRDEAEQKRLLLQGEADLTTISSLEAWRMLGHSGINVARGQGLDREMIGFNCRCPPFDDVRVRQAIAYAIDYEALLATDSGYPFVRTDGPIPAQIEGHDDNLLLYRRNVDKATRLLREAGYAAGFSTVLALNEGVRPRSRIADLVAQSLRAVSIEVKIEALLWADFLERLKQRISPMFAWNWVPDYPDPDCYVYPLYDSQSLENQAGYHNAVMDSLLGAARAESDRAARADLYREIQRIAIQDAPYLFMVQGPDLVVYRDHVGGFVYNPLVQTGDPIYFYPLYKQARSL